MQQTYIVSLLHSQRTVAISTTSCKFAIDSIY
jgi:hypothetical protein